MYYSARHCIKWVLENTANVLEKSLNIFSPTCGDFVYCCTNVVQVQVLCVLLCFECCVLCVRDAQKNNILSILYGYTLRVKKYMHCTFVHSVIANFLLKPHPLPTRGYDGKLGEFWIILNATERSFLHLYADALSSSNSVPCLIWGQGRGLGQLSPFAPMLVFFCFHPLVGFCPKRNDRLTDEP